MLKSWNEKEIVTMPLHYRLGQPADALCISGLATQVFLDTYATSANRTTHDARRTTVEEAICLLRAAFR